MDRLRKIGLLLWHNKERLFFAGLVAVLGWRAYQVMNPEKTPPPPPHAAPRRPTEEDVPLPKIPPAIEPRVPDDAFATIHKRNPFWYYSGQTAPEQGPAPAAEPPITLVRILGNRARLAMDGAKKYCAEGDTFGHYEIVGVDREAQTCEVYSTQSGKTQTLHAQGS